MRRSLLFRNAHVKAGVIAALIALVLLPTPALASFHLWEVTKIMTNHDGDTAIQAVEMKAIAAGENLVNTAALVVYSPAGVAGATLGTFGADLPAAGAVNGARLLFATMKWRQKFGLTPDLQISAGLLQTNGQIAFQKPTCVVNAIAYGAVSTFVGGNVSAAPPIPSGNAPILVRIEDNAIAPACPQAEDAANKFQLRTATPTFPVTFTNYSGASVNVSSTVTSVEGTPGAPSAPRAYPNPFRGSIRVESARAHRVAVYDVQGGLVRVLDDGGAAAFRGDWDGRDRFGKLVPAGVYFISFGAGSDADVKRVAILR